MPFGLKISQDSGCFPDEMDQIVERCPSVLSIHDDLCVDGKSKKEYDSNLHSLMHVAPPAVPPVWSPFITQADVRKHDLGTC